jgi:hypothetical protein
MNAAGTPQNLKSAKANWNLKDGTSIYVPQQLVAAVLKYARQLDLASIMYPESNETFDSSNADIDFLEENASQIEELVITDSQLDQTEDEWIAEITGLPVGFKPGVDKLPAKIVKAISEIKRKETREEIAIAYEIINQRHDPDYGTHEWIDMMEKCNEVSSRNSVVWTWKKYLRMVQQEAREGFEEAKEELAILKSHGWLDAGFRAKKSSTKGFESKTKAKRAIRKSGIQNN